MTKKNAPYIANPVDKNGHANYTTEDNDVWRQLITRQRPIVESYGCAEYLRGLALLNLPTDHVPQCPEITAVLRETTGWALEPVPAIIPPDHFFHLLANKKFPAATFIRRQEDIDYLEEPDLFHEVFGHCPLLTNPAFAAFTHTYGKLCEHASAADRDMFATLYWFTIEFGLMQTKSGLRAYGGGILSSKNETIYCIESPVPERKPFDVIDIMRTPFRIDIMQPIYFVIENPEVLFHVIDMDLFALTEKARKLGMHSPHFKPNTTEQT